MTQEARDFLKDWLQPGVIFATIIAFGVAQQQKIESVSQDVREIKAVQKDQVKDIVNMKDRVSFIEFKTFGPSYSLK